MKWYLVGFGSDETLIRKKIVDYNVANQVILLGKKNNPYPYMSACDIYIQPSRYEGKAVAVREAQILGKPVVITKFPTAASQLENGVDGIILPMDAEGFSEELCRLIKNKDLLQTMAQSTLMREYGNASEVEKLNQFLKGCK